MRHEQVKAIDSLKRYLANLTPYSDTRDSFRGTASKESGYKEKKHYYVINGKEVEIEQAVKTDLRSFNRVMLTIAEHIEADRLLPPLYKKIALQILKREITAPAKARNAPSRSEHYRSTVVIAVALLETLGITPTTSNIDNSIEPMQATGCGMVAEFIGGKSSDFELIKSRYQAVASIWKKRESDPATKGKAKNWQIIAAFAGYSYPSREDILSGRGQSLDEFIDSLKPVSNK